MTECVRNTIPDKGNNSAELSTVLSTWSPISTVIKLMTVEKTGKSINHLSKRY
nr:MAG TPA: hypothetical protein [Caudoviricetes sp.]